VFYSYFVYGIYCVKFWWCHFGFFLWFLPTKPCALKLTQPLKMSTRDFSWGKGGWCVWLTTYLCSAESREYRGP